MKVLHINYQTESSSACLRIIECQLKGKRIKPYLLTIRNSTNFKEIQLPKNHRFFFQLRIIYDKILHKIKRNKKYFFSYNSLTIAQPRLINFSGYDIIHFHWVGHGSIDYEILESLEEIENKKVYIHFHDLYGITGGCHLPFQCQGFKNSCARCPHTFFPKLVSKNFKRKEEIFKRIKPIAIFPSKILKGYCENATLLNSFEKKIVIPNPYNLKIAQRLIHSKSQKLTLLMIAKNLNDPNKQVLKVVEALKKINSKTQYGIKLILMGNLEKDINTLFEVEHITFTSNPEVLNQAYRKCHFTIVASKFETFSQVALESLVNGVPVITFQNLGASDFIKNNLNGLVLPQDRFDLLTEKLLEFDKNRSKIMDFRKGFNSKSLEGFNYPSIENIYFKEYKE